MAEGYNVSTVEINEITIKKNIQEQEKSDITMDKLSVKEYGKSFKGEPVIRMPWSQGRGGPDKMKASVFRG